MQDTLPGRQLEGPATVDLIGGRGIDSVHLARLRRVRKKHAGGINAKRIALCAAYRQGLEPLAQRGMLALPQAEPEGVHGNGHLFYVLLKDLETRSGLIAHLKARGFHSVFHYVPLHSAPAGRKFGRVAGPMTVTDDIASRLLRLPLYYNLGEADVADIVAAVHDFFRNG